MCIRDRTNDIVELGLYNDAISPAEGDRAAASAARRRALDELERQLRGGYRTIQALDESEVTEAERRGLYESYGWASSEIGRFNDERVISLAKLAVRVAEENQIPAARRYTTARLGRLQHLLGIVEQTSDTATGGVRQGATRQRLSLIHI